MGKLRKGRLLFGIGALLLIFSIAFISMSSGTAMAKLSGKPPINYNNAKESDYQKDLEIEGTLIEVYDYVAEGYTEHTTFGITTGTTTDCYYYIADCPYSTEDTIMIVKVSATSQFGKSVEALCDALYDDYDNLEKYIVPFSGIVESNEQEVVQYAQEWLDEAEWDGIKIAPYSINTTRTASVSVSYFIIGIVCSILFAVYIAILILVLIKNRNKQSPQPAYNSGYTNDTYSSQNNSYAQPSYQSQNNDYTQPSYQSQNNDYAQPSYQSQNNDYTQPSSFQTQDGSSDFGTNNETNYKVWLQKR